MNILVIGKGGREAAVFWKLSQSERVSKIICAPGNAGIANLAECMPVDPMDIDGQLALAKKHKVDLVIVGPEDPLVAGIVNRFEREGIPIVGPSQAAAEIEGSKIYCTNLLNKYHIPIPNSTIFYNPLDAKEYIKSLANSDFPLVIKPDGLTAGKGVTIVKNKQHASRLIGDMMIRGKFGEAGNRIIIQEFVSGRECSMIVLTDGENIVPFLPSRDFKRAKDGDQGLNTGGMGAYSPLADVPLELQQKIINTIIKPTLLGLKNEGRPYRGVLYTGLMISDNGKIWVLEYNCRFGDPETQVVLPLLESDFAELMMQTATGSLKGVKAKWSGQSAVCVVLASKGYPGKPVTGFPITGLEIAESENTIIFHAGTAEGPLDSTVTAGGRVLGVVGLGDNLLQARTRAYCAANIIDFKGRECRWDIAK